MRTAAAPVVLHPQTHVAAKPKAVATNVPAPAPTPQKQQARKQAPPPAPEMRTAYSTPPASNRGLLAGAQPVVPAGSFEARWTALR